MNLDELRAVQSRERATDSLQELRESFYADVAEYVESLREERTEAAERADDPFSAPEVSRLTDEIEMAEQVAEAVYERRVGKIVKQASLAAAGMTADEEGLTAEERELYASLVDLIEANKRHVLDVLAGEESANAEETDGDGTGGDEKSRDRADAAPEAGPTDGGVDAADLMGGAGATDDEEPDVSERPDEPPAVADDEATDEPTDDVERQTVRITRDVGEIFGVDERVYTLETDDVVTLPSENADPLVDREAAERLE